MTSQTPSAPTTTTPSLDPDQHQAIRQAIATEIAAIPAPYLAKLLSLIRWFRDAIEITMPATIAPAPSNPERPPLNFPVDSYAPPMLNREALYGDSER